MTYFEGNEPPEQPEYTYYDLQADIENEVYTDLIEDPPIEVILEGAAEYMEKQHGERI